MAYFHVIGFDCFAKMMMHNTKLREGLCPSGSVLAPFMPEGTIISPYSSFNDNQGKEAVWERIRRSGFPNLPSRIGALFLFDGEAAMEKARQNWWPHRECMYLEVEIRDGTTHRADAQWLNSPERQWEESAHAYWSGTATADPIHEVLLHGYAYFPEWQTFELGNF